MDTQTDRVRDTLSDGFIVRRADRQTGDRQKNSQTGSTTNINVQLECRKTDQERPNNGQNLID